MLNRDARAENLTPPPVRVGLLIPSVNTMAELQFAHYRPRQLGFHVARLRMSGKFKRPFAVLREEIATGAAILADADPSLIVFHCTGASMRSASSIARGISDGSAFTFANSSGSESRR